MNGIIERLGGVFWAVCLGVVALFVFFAAIGGFAPGDVVWLTSAVGVLAAVFAIHAMRVGHVLRGPRNGETMRILNHLRERRGF